MLSPPASKTDGDDCIHCFASQAPHQEDLRQHRERGRGYIDTEFEPFPPLRVGILILWEKVMVNLKQLALEHR